MDDDVTLRPATARDRDFLTDMLVAAVNWHPDRDLSRKRVLANPDTARYVTGWPHAGELGVIAVDRDGAPVGAAWLRLFSAERPGYGFVAADVPELSIGVVAGWRGRGIGRALVRAVTRQAARDGVACVSLGVERANFAARLYRGEGFVVVSSGPDADTMVRDLTAPAGGRGDDSA